MCSWLCPSQMTLSSYLHDFDFDPIFHRSHIIIHLGFLHSTFYATMQAIMENIEQKWARNQLLLSSTCLTSSVWQVSLLSECSLSALLCQSYSDYTQSKCFCLLMTWFGVAPKGKACCIFCFILHVWHGPFLTKWYLFLITLPSSYLQSDQRFVIAWLYHQFKVLPSSTLWKLTLFSLGFLGHPLSHVFSSPPQTTTACSLSSLRQIL